MVDVLRDDAGSVGLVTANGGNIQKHAFGVYSTTPPDRRRSATPIRSSRSTPPSPPVEVAEGYVGPADVESWTVMHERDGSRGRAHAVLRTPSGARAWGVTSDAGATEALEGDDDPVGWAVTIGPEADLRLS